MIATSNHASEQPGIFIAQNEHGQISSLACYRQQVEYRFCSYGAIKFRSLMKHHLPKFTMKISQTRFEFFSSFTITILILDIIIIIICYDHFYYYYLVSKPMTKKWLLVMVIGHIIQQVTASSKIFTIRPAFY